jgi:hypothetical protein
MVEPVAELTMTEEGEMVFTEVRPAYSTARQSRRISDDTPPGYQPAARTTLFARDTPEAETSDRRGEDAERYYDRLWRYHHRWDDDRMGRRAFKDKVSVTRALASSLPMSQAERHEAVAFVRAHDGRRFNQCGGILGMALGTLAALRDETVSDYAARLDAPLERRLTNCDRFVEMCARHDVDGAAARKKAKAIRREER